MKVIVGMSGGVDSSVAAYMLKKAGHEVVGVFLDFLDDKSAFDLLISLSEKLGIEIHYKNYAKEFKDTVIKYFVDEYKVGHTPNPCAFCNGSMKFKKLIEALHEFSADKIATGHYAEVVNDKRYAIRKSKNLQKDQSYMLYTLDQDMLKHLLLPIGDMTKEEVRNVARELNLDVAEKKDSQDVCFIYQKGGNYDYAEFIKEYDFGVDYKEKLALGMLKESDIIEKPYLKSGEFVDKEGKVLGYHDGIINYTIGQRRGLNIAFGERKFVVDIDAATGRIILGNNEDLDGRDFKLRDIVWQYYDKEEVIDRFCIKKSLFDSIRKVFGERLLCKVRYRHIEEPCAIKVIDDDIICSFLRPVRAITKGQAAVFYDKKGTIIFGGTIA